MKINYYDIIKSPVVTEKTTLLSAENKVVFSVSPRATKMHVKKAIEKIFSVEVTKVNIINIQAKEVRFKGRVGTRNSKRKAIVTYKSDSEIDFAGGAK